MFKILFKLIKLGVFALIVIILANWIRLDGKTISDQVKTQLSHAEKSQIVKDVKSWTKETTDEISKKDQDALKDFLNRQAKK